MRGVRTPNGRILAYFRSLCATLFLRRKSACNTLTTESALNSSAFQNCQNRYPSPLKRFEPVWFEPFLRIGGHGPRFSSLISVAVLCDGIRFASEGLR